MTENEAAHAMLRIPLFSGRETGDFDFERLGGLTNRNYKVTAKGSGGEEAYVLRIAEDGTEEYINRRNEEVNAKAAARAGVNAEVLFFDAGDGLQRTRFIHGSVTMDNASFKQEGAAARAGRALRMIHDSGETFANPFDIFQMMDEYLGILRGKQAWIPEGYEAVQAEAEAVRAALAGNPAPLAPCHCDPLAENFLDTGTRMYIVDWEYAGNNDSMWDLGDLSVEAEFGPEQDQAMLGAYFCGPPPAAKLGRMVLYKGMCDLLWTLWGALQVAGRNPAEDFRAYAQGRFQRCQTLMRGPEFANHLAAVQSG